MSKMDTKSRFRMKTFSCLFLAYMCYTWNRKSVPFVLPLLIGSGLPKDVAGSITSFQNLAYAISKFAIGVLSDHTNPRFLLITGLFLSGTTAVLFPLWNSPLAAVALWFCNGLLQGCGWPACSKIIQEKYHHSLFGTLWSVLSCSTNVAGVVSAAVSTYIVLNFDWKYSVIFAGGISIMMSLICAMVISETPSSVRQGKKTTESNKKEKSSADRHKWKNTWNDLQKYPLIALVSFCYFVVFCAKTCFTDWAQAYLMGDHGLDQIAASVFLGSLEAGGLVGCLSAGYGSDKMAVNMRGNKEPQGNRRMLLAVVYMAGLCIALHLFCFHTSDSKVALGILGIIFGTCLYGPITIYGIVATESVPSHLSGTSHAVVALAANVGGILAGFPVTVFADLWGSWWAVFAGLEVFAVMTTSIMLLAARLWLPPNEPELSSIKKSN